MAGPWALLQRFCSGLKTLSFALLDAIWERGRASSCFRGKIKCIKESSIYQARSRLLCRYDTFCKGFIYTYLLFGWPLGTFANVLFWSENSFFCIIGRHLGARASEQLFPRQNKMHQRILYIYIYIRQGQGTALNRKRKRERKRTNKGKTKGKTKGKRNSKRKRERKWPRKGKRKRESKRNNYKAKGKVKGKGTAKAKGKGKGKGRTKAKEKGKGKGKGQGKVKGKGKGKK